MRKENEVEKETTTNDTKGQYLKLTQNVRHVAPVIGRQRDYSGHVHIDCWNGYGHLLPLCSSHRFKPRKC